MNIADKFGFGPKRDVVKEGDGWRVIVTPWYSPHHSKLERMVNDVAAR